MRWLLIKDLQILRRSPLLVGLLVIYPIALALMIGFALSSPPGKPKVAFYSAVAPGKGRISFGSQQINVSKYANQLFQSVQPIKVSSRDQAVALVRRGQASAAVIVPGDIVGQIQNLITQGVGNPTVEVILNSKDPLERQPVDGRHHRARGQDDADRFLRGGDRGDRLADVRGGAAGGGDARARALRERLLTAGSRAADAGAAAAREGRAGGRLRRRGDA